MRRVGVVLAVLLGLLAVLAGAAWLGGEVVLASECSVCVATMVQNHEAAINETGVDVVSRSDRLIEPQDATFEALRAGNDLPLSASPRLENEQAVRRVGALSSSERWEDDRLLIDAYARAGQVKT